MNNTKGSALSRLINLVPGIAATVPCEQVMECFETHKTQSLVVLENNKPIGFLSSKKTADALSSRYGYAVYQKRPVTELMLKDFLVVSVNHHFSDIVQRALVRKPDSVFEDIVVVQDSLYVGLISIDRVLMEQRIRLIQHAEEVEQSRNKLAEANKQLQLAMKEIKAKEEQLVQTEKMASIGTLSAGIAHDFNNMLCAILSSVQMLKTKLPFDSPLMQFCKIIESAGQRSAALTRQLLDFSQKNIIHKKVVSLNEVIHETTRMLERSIRKEIRVELALEQELEQIEADETQLQQVIMNLSLNARDAMPNGGTLRISTSMVNLTAEDCYLKPQFQPGTYVQLDMKDSGTGIPPEVLSKIFEPFFTTKPVGKGTGLGLAVAYGIVQRHGGQITVTSEVGKGTLFSIFFKPYAIKIGERQDKVMSTSAIPGQGTILLVDDEDMVLFINGEFLESLGYHVLRVKSGEEAICLYQEHCKTIDLVILDMVMPGKNGHETFLELQKIIPQVKVIIATGYTDEAAMQAVLKDGAAGFIRKPFDHTEFSRLIQQVLGHQTMHYIQRFAPQVA
jgi:signal transduction histidine kinase/ActR/RegA family two-component response regulator